jgi:small subunit ribosomal protein S2
LTTVCACGKLRSGSKEPNTHTSTATPLIFEIAEVAAPKIWGNNKEVFIPMPEQITMKDLLEAGVHFGHQSKRWNPKMKQYIFTARNGVHVIDLAKTAPMLQTAYDFIKDTVANGGNIIFVGSKKQARHIIAEEAQRAGAMYITERWLGGLLTNFDSMKKSLRKLEQLKAQKEAGEYQKFTKKEQAIIDHEINRLQRVMGGIEGLKQLPQALFIIDPHKEDIAVIEANQTGVPVVAVVDTNCDPSQIDYPVPGNDDALKAIKLFVSHMANAVIEGSALAKASSAKDTVKTADTDGAKSDKKDASKEEPVTKVEKTAKLPQTKKTK